MAKSELSGSREWVQVLKKFEPELFKEVKKNLNSELKSILQPIEGQINSSVGNVLKSKMPNMFHNGRTAWSGVKIKSVITANPKKLIYIDGTGRSGFGGPQLGFDYAELAGIERRPARSVSKGWGQSTPGYHSYIYNGQGKAFNRKLGSEFGKPGRFLWIRVLRKKPEIEQKVELITADYGFKLTRRMG